MTSIYNCDACNYSSDRYANYKRHLVSKSHLEKQNQYDTLGHPVSIEPPKDSGIILDEKSFYCSCCEKVLSKQYKSEHFKICTAYQLKMKMAKDRQVLELKNDMQWSKKEFEYILLLKDKEKENQALNHKIEILELKHELAAKTQIINSQNNNNNKNHSDNKSVSFIYIKNNYKDAPVYSDIMAKPLTAEERESIEGVDPATACAKLIASRCLTDVDMDKRPFHCLDMARNKFAVRVYTNWGDAKWKIDSGGEHILSCGFEKIREEYPIRKVDNDTKIKNLVGLNKMMLPINKKRILKEVCRLGHVNA